MVWQSINPDANMSFKICHDKATANNPCLLLYGTNAFRKDTLSLNMKINPIKYNKNT